MKVGETYAWPRAKPARIRTGFRPTRAARAPGAACARPAGLGRVHPRQHCAPQAAKPVARNRPLRRARKASDAAACNTGSNRHRTNRRRGCRGESWEADPAADRARVSALVVSVVFALALPARLPIPARARRKPQPDPPPARPRPASGKPWALPRQSTWRTAPAKQETGATGKKGGMAYRRRQGKLNKPLAAGASRLLAARLVANARGTCGYRCVSRLALHPKPSAPARADLFSVALAPIISRRCDFPER